MAAVAAAALGIYALTGAMKKDKFQAPQPAAMPVAPTVANAQDTAKAQLEKRRRISLLQGGNTDVTRGAGIVGAENVGTKSLLGQ